MNNYYSRVFYEDNIVLFFYRMYLYLPYFYQDQDQDLYLWW